MKQILQVPNLRSTGIHLSYLQGTMPELKTGDVIILDRLGFKNVRVSVHAVERLPRKGSEAEFLNVVRAEPFTGSVEGMILLGDGVLRPEAFVL